MPLCLEYGRYPIPDRWDRCDYSGADSRDRLLTGSGRGRITNLVDAAGYPGEVGDVIIPYMNPGPPLSPNAMIWFWIFGAIV